MQRTRRIKPELVVAGKKRIQPELVVAPQGPPQSPSRKRRLEESVRKENRLEVEETQKRKKVGEPDGCRSKIEDDSGDKDEEIDESLADRVENKEIHLKNAPKVISMKSYRKSRQIPRSPSRAAKDSGSEKLRKSSEKSEIHNFEKNLARKRHAATDEFSPSTKDFIAVPPHEKAAGNSDLRVPRQDSRGASQDSQSSETFNSQDSMGSFFNTRSKNHNDQAFLDF